MIIKNSQDQSLKRHNDIAAKVDQGRTLAYALAKGN